MGKAYFKQSNGMYAVNIVAACGVMTPGQLEGLGKAARECGVYRLKLTTRQTIVAVIDELNLSSLVDRLPDLELAVSPYGNAVRAVKACAGSNALCPRALGDALGLGIKLQEKYLGRETPKDVKIAVAGCPRGCTDPLCADFGIVARSVNSFDVYLGGRGGSAKPVHGVLFAEKVAETGVFELFDHVLKTYASLAQPVERISAVVARLGIEPFLPPEELIAINNAGEPEDEDFLAFLDLKEGDAS
ncbi:NAD(P)/FAD-dependent oxidoreductase [Desulfotruncus alcoholivorax]|uniref:nitrite reductase n=1 Tax=Desulfotruncus alcoholivorax TaxID=265477 RepID=UPI000405DB71|nr:nitrite reductase [Desulfotruncus alcoholivorax]